MKRPNSIERLGEALVKGPLGFARVTLLFCLFLFVLSAHGQIALLNYAGRVSVENRPFNGAGLFAFSIQEASGSVFWVSGDFPIEGSTNSPLRVLKLPVTNGVYSIALGDTTLGMPALDLAPLRRARSPMLRIWFNDGANGWRRAGEDAPLSEALRAADHAPITTAQAETILREIRELRALVDRPRANAVVAGAAAAPSQAPQMTIVSIAGAPSLGRADAPLVLLEFTDFECPFCKQAHETTMAELINKYVQTGKLRLVTRNLPLPFHPNAEGAAAAALCAHQQQHFWEMRDKLFSMSNALSATNYLKAAEELKLDMRSFRVCMESNTFAQQVKKDVQDAFAAGISGTPTFILGIAEGDQVTGEILVGARTFAAFEEDIRKRLSSK